MFIAPGNATWEQCRCNRPVNEKPYLLIPVGYPAKDCTVPDVPKKPLSQALQWNRENVSGWDGTAA